MKRKSSSQEQIISVHKEHQAGASVPDPARHHGAVEHIIYRFRTLFGPVGGA